MFPLNKTAYFLIGLICVGGCTLGPKYTRPSVQVPLRFKESAHWKNAQPKDALPRGAWWQIFKDPRLDALEAQVNISNQNIAIAQAQYAQAHALAAQAKSSFFPSLATTSSLTRAHTASSSNDLKALSTTLLNTNVSWEVDLWGKIRRTLEANRANAALSAADLENAKLSAHAQLAQDYFQLGSLDAQKQLLENTIVIYQKFLTLTKNRYVGGIAAEADVLSAQTQLESTEAQAIDLGVLRSQIEHAIAVLTGQSPSNFALPPVTLSVLVPPVPVGLPSTLLEQRPDIVAAEKAVIAANALIGVAQAAYFPTLTLTASGSSSSSDLSKLFIAPNPLWALGAALAETFFDGGLRRAQTAQARAVYDQNVAMYRQTALTAMAQVEDNLAALRILEQEASLQDQAVKHALRAVLLETRQYKAGTVSALDVITLQAVALTQEKTAAMLRAQRLNACVLLIEYLGGGWKA